MERLGSAISPARPHSRTGRPSAHGAERGFTLVEILVTIVIIGIIVSAATLALGVLGADRESEQQARRLWAVLQQAREEAELQGLDLGIYVAREGYEFLRYDVRRRMWLPAGDDPLYATRELPEGLRVRVWLESREIVLRPTLPERVVEEKDDGEQQLAQESAARKFPPQIVVLSSGEIMPFELQIERDGAEALWRVVAQPDHDLRVERRGDNREWIVVAQTSPPAQDDRQRTSNAR